MRRRWAAKWLPGLDTSTFARYPPQQRPVSFRTAEPVEKSAYRKKHAASTLFEVRDTEQYYSTGKAGRILAEGAGKAWSALNHAARMDESQAGVRLSGADRCQVCIEACMDYCVVYSVQAEEEVANTGMQCALCRVKRALGPHPKKKGKKMRKRKPVDLGCKLPFEYANAEQRQQQNIGAVTAGHRFSRFGSRIQFNHSSSALGH